MKDIDRQNYSQKINELMKNVNRVHRRNVAEFKQSVYDFLKERQQMYPERYPQMKAN